MRIGFFGGTFNPIHIGHLRSCIDVYETFMLDKIIFIPTGIPPHKNKDIVDAEYRYEMVKLAADEISFFDVSRIEIDTKNVNYTIDTFNKLSKIYNKDELFYIVGTDAFLSIDTWKEYKQLLKYMTFIIMKRPEYDLSNIFIKYKNMIEFKNADETKIYPAYKNTAYIDKLPAFDVSSSDIRKRIREGKNIMYLTPNSVINFIKAKGLYKNG